MRFNRVALLFLFVGILGVFGAAQTASPSPNSNDVTTPYKITSSPRAMYTEKARAERIQGTIKLKVTLLSNGKIGDIVDVTKENRQKFEESGLTEVCIRAARGIKFKPKMVNGQPVSVVVTREYMFSIY